MDFIGYPECKLALAQCVVYLALAPKSVAIYYGYEKAADTVNSTAPYGVPLHIRNAPTKLMKDLGYHAGYKYAHEFEGGFVADNYWPDKLKDDPPRLLRLTGRGMEKQLLERLRHWWAGKYEE